jgi:hypothetical protein
MLHALHAPQRLAHAAAYLVVSGALLCPALRAQGTLTPPGAPAPTQKSLQEIYDRVVALEARNQQLENVLLGLAQAQGTLPWSFSTVASPSPGRSSIATTPAGRPAVVYPALGGGLVYAEFNGTTWVTSTVDSATGAGRFSVHLRFTPGGQPAVAYATGTVTGITPLIYAGDVRYAVLTGTVTSGTWSVQTIETIPSTTFGNFELSLAFQSNGRPALSYYNLATDALRYAQFNGSVWQFGTVIASGDQGNENSLAFQPDGRPAVAYRGLDFGSTGALRYAVFNGLSWDDVVLDDGGNGGSDSVGSSPRLLFAPDGTGLVVHGDLNNNQLRLSRLSIAIPPAVAPASVTTAAIPGTAGATRAGFALNGAGQPAVAHTDAAALRYSAFDGSSWRSSVVESTSFFCDQLAFVGGQPAVLYFDGGGLLRYAVRTPFAAP